MSNRNNNEASNALEVVDCDVIVTCYLQVQQIAPDSMVTMDYRTDRVRIVVGEDGKVAREPRVG